MRSLSRHVLRAATVVGVVVASLAPVAAHASPIGDIHEGAGYAAAAGPGGQASACVSTAQFIPAQSVTVTTAPIGASATGLARATATCVGTLAVSQGLVLEVWTPDNSKRLSRNCGAATICDIVIPAGWGVFYIMPSAFWTISPTAAWVVMNPVNNDGYCNGNSTGTEVVCRAWATGLT